MSSADEILRDAQCDDCGEEDDILGFVNKRRVNDDKVLEMELTCENCINEWVYSA